MNYPSAFPILEQGGNGLELTDPGMTLRDYFAVQALPAIYRQTAVDFDEGKISVEDVSPNAMAREAYQIADAMLAERERSENEIQKKAHCY